MTNFEKNYQEIIKIISKERRRKILLQLSKNSLHLAGAVFFCIFLASLLDMIFEFDPSVRSGIIIGTVFLVAILFLIYIISPLIEYWTERKKYSIETIARELGVQFEELHDSLVNVLQVYKTSIKNKQKHSVDLAVFSVFSMLKVLKGLRISSLYPFQKVKKAARFFITPVLLTGLALGIFPSQFKGGLIHMLNPATQFKPTPVDAILVKPGDVTRVEGDSCDIFVQIEGVFNGPISLSLKEKTRELSEIKIIESSNNGIYQHTIKNLRVPIRYFVKADKEVSDTYSIKVEKRPFVRKLNARLDFPEYTDLPFRYLEDNVGDVTALKGTRVKLKTNSNKSLKKARIVFSDGKTKQMKISEENAEVEFVIQNDISYKIELEDQFGYLNFNPIDYTIRVLEDSYPVVDIISPGKDVDLSEAMKLPLLIEAEDDFGFSLMQLGYKIETNMPFPGLKDTSYQYIKLSLNGNHDTKLTVDYLWELADLKMMPEDIIFYFAVIWDNDRISGPKRSLSKVYTARFPSVYEIFEEAASSDEENIRKLEEVLSESKELKERLDQISRELTQQQEMDWLKKQDIEEVAQKQKELQKTVDEVRRELDQMVERLEQNQMLSFETLEKFQELQQLFSEIMTPELQKSLDELRKAAEELNENKLKQALNKLQISQENLLKNLERTINLLKRLQLEERIDQATKLTENLLERQQALNEQLKDSTPQEIANMLHQQQKLETDAKNLDDLLAQLDQDLEQKAQFQSEIMDSLQNEIQKAINKMQNTEQNMQQGKMQQAKSSGQLSEQNLQKMLKQLQQLKKSFVQQQKQEFMKQFSETSNKLLQLSKDQENLMQKTQTLSPTSPQLGEIAENQQQQLQHLGRITDQLYQLSQKTFFVTPEIGQAIGKAMSGMQRALQLIEQRSSKVASGQQAAAIGGLNESIMNIQKAMQNLQGSSSAVGFEEFMKRLEQMTGKQQGLNQQTLQLGNQQQGQMTLEQQAAMARLAAGQEALRKSLEQLQKEFGNRSEITGRMDGITKEMEKVVEELERKRVSPRMIDRQKRILSRMLDAQRSLHQREYSRKRESRSGETYFVRSPGEIDEKVKQQKERFLEDLIRARKVGFNSDYLELIRNYFQALTEKK